MEEKCWCNRAQPPVSPLTAARLPEAPGESLFKPPQFFLPPGCGAAVGLGETLPASRSSRGPGTRRAISHHCPVERSGRQRLACSTIPLCSLCKESKCGNLAQRPPEQFRVPGARGMSWDLLLPKGRRSPGPSAPPVCPEGPGASQQSEAGLRWPAWPKGRARASAGRGRANRARRCRPRPGPGHSWIWGCMSSFLILKDTRRALPTGAALHSSLTRLARGLASCYAGLTSGSGLCPTLASWRESDMSENF